MALVGSAALEEAVPAEEGPAGAAALADLAAGSAVEAPAGVAPAEAEAAVEAGSAAAVPVEAAQAAGNSRLKGRSSPMFYYFSAAPLETGAELILILCAFPWEARVSGLPRVCFLDSEKKFSETH